MYADIHWASELSIISRSQYRLNVSSDATHFLKSRNAKRRLSQCAGNEHDAKSPHGENFLDFEGHRRGSYLRKELTSVLCFGTAAGKALASFQVSSGFKVSETRRR